MDANLRNALILSAALSVVTALFTWAANQLLNMIFKRVKHGDCHDESDDVRQELPPIKLETIIASNGTAGNAHEVDEAEEARQRYNKQCSATSATVEVAEECLA